MVEIKYVDISEYSFDEFVSFFFDRPVLPKKKAEEYDPWHFHLSVTCDAERVCGYYIKLFRRPEFLFTRFSEAQLEEGLWAMKGPNLECSAGAIISNTDLPFQSREECVKAMGELFRRFFAVNSLETSGLMWWDSMCFDWDCGNRNRKRGGEDLLLQDILFRTLSDILELDSPFCQGAALHGLGHLHHPGTKELIGSYLERHPNLSAEQKDYATAAARFEVL